MESVMAEAVVFKTSRKRLFLNHYCVHRTLRMTYPAGLTWDTRSTPESS